MLIKIEKRFFLINNLNFQIKAMLTWTFEEISDVALLDFGNLLEYAALIYNTGPYLTTLPNDVFPLILDLIASDNILHSLLGNRVLQHLLDRNNNRLQFETPR